MSFENPRQPEGINVTAENPLREFFTLLLGFGGLVLATLLLLTWSAQWLAQFVPFSVEQRLSGSVVSAIAQPKTADEQAREAYIQGLAARLVRHLDAAERVPVVAHYDVGATENAFATLGGHVVFYRGLVDRVPHENALAMLVAHEIAHIQLRHPIVANGRALTVALALGALIGLADNAVIGSIANWLGVSSIMTFSRAQERAADALAAELVLAEYGHLRGASDLFEVLLDTHGDGGVVGFLSTHPGLRERIATLEALAEEEWEAAPNGAIVPSDAELTPLPWKS
ncbi:MAG: M48 family metallopeptidase [Pseudomonadota bacterium]